MRSGLSARSKILFAIEEEQTNARGVSRKTGLNYRSVLHHLRLLEYEGVVGRKGSKPYIWFLTGAGQLRLDEAIRKRL